MTNFKSAPSCDISFIHKQLDEAKYTINLFINNFEKGDKSIIPLFAAQNFINNVISMVQKNKNCSHDKCSDSG